MNSIEIKNLSLNFGDVKVLKDLNLSVDKGEFLVLLGASGCGKSTLLNCIAGLLDITDGQIFINNQNVTCMSHLNEELEWCSNPMRFTLKCQLKVIFHLASRMQSFQKKR